MSRVVGASADSTVSGDWLPERVKLSLRLEKQEPPLTDVEAAELAKWLREMRGRVRLVKLWLFNNDLTDAGVEALAKELVMEGGEGERGRG